MMLNFGGKHSNAMWPNRPFQLVILLFILNLLSLILVQVSGAAIKELQCMKELAPTKIATYTSSITDLYPRAEVAMATVNSIADSNNIASSDAASRSGNNTVFLLQEEDEADELLKILNIIGAFFVIVSIVKYLELLDTNYCIKLMLVYCYPTTSYLLQKLKYIPEQELYAERHKRSKGGRHKRKGNGTSRGIQKSRMTLILGHNLVILLLNLPLLFLNPISPMLRKSQRAIRRVVLRILRMIVLIKNFKNRDNDDDRYFSRAPEYYKRQYNGSTADTIFDGDSNKSSESNNSSESDSKKYLRSSSSQTLPPSSIPITTSPPNFLIPPLQQQAQQQQHPLHITEVGSAIKAVVSNTITSIKSKMDPEEATATIESEEEDLEAAPESLNDLKELFSIFNSNRTIHSGSKRSSQHHANSDLRTLEHYVKSVKNTLLFIKNNFPDAYQYFAGHCQCSRCGVEVIDNSVLERVERHGLGYCHLETFHIKVFAYYYLNYAVLAIKELLDDVDEEEKNNNKDKDRTLFVSNRFSYNEPASEDELERTVILKKDLFRVCKTSLHQLYDYLVEIYIEDVHMKPLVYSINNADNLIKFGDFEIYCKRNTSKCRPNGRLITNRLSHFLAKTSHPRTFCFARKFRDLLIRHGKVVDRGEYCHLQDLHERIAANFSYAMYSDTVDLIKEEEWSQTHRYLVELLMVFADRMIFFKDYEWGLVALDFGGYCWLLVLKSFNDSRHLFFSRGPTMSSSELNRIILKKLGPMHFHERNRFLTLPVIYSKYFINLTSDLGSVNLYDFMLSGDECQLGLHPSARDDSFVASIYSLYRRLG